MSQPPSSLGFSMPAEWAPHEATWLAWPKNRLTFPKGMIGAVEEAYCMMAGALQHGEKVKILVDSEGEESRVRKKLQKSGVDEKNVLFCLIKSADVWIRDYGPTFLLNRKSGELGAVRWIFNAWGGKYDDLLEDNATGDAVAASVDGLKLFRPGIVMEGGSIEVNGDGRVLTTEQCLLNRNRNPGLSKDQIEACIRDYLGTDEVIWLKEGIAGDDTDGHVDDFARFVGKNAVACAREENGGDANFAALEAGRLLLEQSGIDVIDLPMPSPIIDREENRRLPASYANFYIGNKAVLVPSFGDAKDREAAGALGRCFPGREIVRIPCRELVYGYGGMHCVTQQEPKVPE